MDKIIGFTPDSLLKVFNNFDSKIILPAIILLAGGFLCARVISAFIVRSFAKHASPHYSMLVRRTTFYIIFMIFIVAALDQMQVDVTSILGAAGVVTLVAGFASRTAISNIISGFFLIAEKPFEIGDYIEYGKIVGEGEVIAIDFLSVKLRTRDNTLIRIPNEELLQNTFRNLTKFPIRRFDLILKVNFQENLEKVKKVLLTVAQDNPLALESPAPELFVLGFGDYAVELKFTAWAKRESYYQLKSQIITQINQALNHHEVEIPVPRQNLQLRSLQEKVVTTAETFTQPGQ